MVPSWRYEGVRHTLRIRMKSCLSTRRKWQLSSLKMMVAARGASFSKASCPKSSPSCRVVTMPCLNTGHISMTNLSISENQIKIWMNLKAVFKVTFPCVITLTEPFQMMYQEVPLSPWLNTKPQQNTVSTKMVKLHPSLSMNYYDNHAYIAPFLLYAVITFTIMSR